MSSASRGLAPREGLKRLLVKTGRTGPRVEPRRGPQASKPGDPVPRTPTVGVRTLIGMSICVYIRASASVLCSEKTVLCSEKKVNGESTAHALHTPMIIPLLPLLANRTD